MRRKEVIDAIVAHRDELRELGVTSLAVFGSTGRDEAMADSDVDLLVEFDPDKRAGLFGFVEVQQRLEEILGVSRVDLVMPDALHEELKSDILNEAISVV